MKKWTLITLASALAAIPLACGSGSQFESRATGGKAGAGGSSGTAGAHAGGASKAGSATVSSAGDNGAGAPSDAGSPSTGGSDTGGQGGNAAGGTAADGMGGGAGVPDAVGGMPSAGTGGAPNQAGAGGAPECTSSAACAAPTPYCDTTDGTCVECLVDVNCENQLQVCASGVCSCKPGLTSCGSACRDTLNDPNACGSCGKQCRADQICGGGTCVCRPGLTDCDGQCVDLKSDVNHCGACAGAACASDQKCEGGGCASTGSGCADGLTECSGSSNRVACVDADTDPNNCGECGNRCDRGELCVAGNCRAYVVAATCSTCPCNDTCNALLENAHTCCDSAATGDVALCVRGDTCP